MKLTETEKYHVRVGYANLVTALEEFERIKHRDSALTGMIHKLYSIIDTLQQHIGPSDKEAQ